MRLDSILFTILLIWVAALAAKAGFCLRTGQSYRFTVWDGGMLLAGKYLGRKGVMLKLVLDGLLAALISAWTMRLVDFQHGKIAIIVGALVTAALNFALAKSEPEATLPKAQVE